MQVMWTGPEAVRVVRRGDLGLDPDDDTELVWDSNTRYLQEVTAEELEALKQVAGSSWAVVEVTEVGESIDASSSESAQPESKPDKSVKGGKSAEA